MKIVIYGDSITNGYNHVTKQSLPILKEKIEAQNQSVTVNLQGVNGDVTSHALQRLDKVLAQQADKVFIFFGANDSAKHHDISPDDFRENLLTMIRAITPEKVVLLTPPYHDDTKDSERRSNYQIETYAQVTIKLSQSLKIPLINVYQTMKEAPDVLDWLQTDGLHFSEIGYQHLSQMILKQLKDTSSKIY